MHGGKYPSAVSIPREGATHASQSEFCLVFSLITFQATLAENVWPPCSKSVRSQVTGLRSFLDRGVTVQYIFNKFCISSQSVTTKVSSINRDTREKGKERGWMKGIGEGRDGG